MHTRRAVLWLSVTIAATTAASAQSGWPCLDVDGDGYALCAFGCTPSGDDVCGDCDDLRGSVRPGATEDCGNGRDDDCDGTTDEIAGGEGPCATGEAGVCAHGTRVCRDGAPYCAPSVEPHPEECVNGADDDCNGFTDGGDAVCSAACQEQPFTDVDQDLVPDCRDNCARAANPLQQDFDRDGMGDACESGVRLCDVDRSGRVDGLDLSALGRTFGLGCPDASFDRRADLTRDCSVDGDDLAVLAPLFGRSLP